MTTTAGLELPPDSTKISAFAAVMRRFAAAVDKLLLSAPSTGWRSLNSSVSMKRTTAGTGNALLIRTGSVVTLSLSGMIPSENGAGLIMTLPVGFRPSQIMSTAAQGLSLRMEISYDGQVRLYDWSANKPIYGTLTYPTAEAWPATLPPVNI